MFPRDSRGAAGRSPLGPLRGRPGALVAAPRTPGKSPNSRPDAGQSALTRPGVAGGRVPHTGEPIMPEPRFVGIDVCKARLDAHCRPDGVALSEPNDTAGVAALVERVRAL